MAFAPMLLASVASALGIFHHILQFASQVVAKYESDLLDDIRG